MTAAGLTEINGGRGRREPEGPPKESGSGRDDGRYADINDEIVAGQDDGRKRN